MGLIVHRIVNMPITSNCYVVYDKMIGCDCIIVDPGSFCNDEVDGFVLDNGLVPRFIILTHEHFDHCWGVNNLVAKYGVPVICSELCAENIKHSDKNCSAFYEDDNSFEVKCETITVESLDYKMNFNGHRITFHHTPGHTDASISLIVDRYLFTGDTLIHNTRTFTKFPTGSVQKLKQSIELYKTMPKGLIVMSGHGEEFELGKEIQQDEKTQE